MATGLAGDKPAVRHISSRAVVAVRAPDDSASFSPNDSAPFSPPSAGGTGLTACFLLGLKPESLDASERLGRG